MSKGYSFRPVSIWCLAVSVCVAAGTGHANPAAPRIDEIAWHNVDSYCRYYRTGDNSDAAEDESSRFILLSQRQSDHRVTVQRTMIRLNGLLRQLRLDRSQTIPGTKRVYRTVSGPETAVTVSISANSDDETENRFSGTIRATNDAGSRVVPFVGECDR